MRMGETGDRTFEWLLLLAFPNGGSTALAKLLLTADGTLALSANAEGQWLVPAMCEPLARWDPATIIDYESVLSCWMSAARRAAPPSATRQDSVLVIEKSPPNMCRYKAIVGMLRCMKTNVVAMTRDPYATCASWHMRYGRVQVERDWGWVGEKPVDEDSYFKALADIWIRRARYLDGARADVAHWIRYEDVSDQPSLVVNSLAQTMPQLKTIDLDAKISVKGSPPQRVRNMNADQILVLTAKQRLAISSVLGRHSELIARFGYDVAPPP
jgi:hypothetical protein